MMLKNIISSVGTKFVFPIACLFISTISVAEDEDFEEVFNSYAIEGTIVISSLDGNQTFIHNDQRANERLCPASTFKITNSIIALETGVLRDENEIMQWDGEQRFMDAWNQDQTLVSAFKVSCVWAYQELAKKIDKGRYDQYLNIMSYGNKIPGPEITTFWLPGGDLAIKPTEQVEFLKNIYREDYPFSEKTYQIMKKIMLEEKTEQYELYTKTGAATQDWIGHGWYVGYINANGTPWFFATNIKINGRPQLPLRKQITLDCLRKKGII